MMKMRKSDSSSRPTRNPLLLLEPSSSSTSSSTSVPLSIINPKNPNKNTKNPILFSSSSPASLQQGGKKNHDSKNKPRSYFGVKPRREERVQRGEKNEPEIGDVCCIQRRDEDGGVRWGRRDSRGVGRRLRRSGGEGARRWRSRPKRRDSRGVGFGGYSPKKERREWRRKMKSRMISKLLMMTRVVAEATPISSTTGIRRPALPLHGPCPAPLESDNSAPLLLLLPSPPPHLKSKP